MAGARAALLVVNSVYDDDGLRRLRAPGADAAALGEVLADGSVGSFHVDILEDEPAQSVRTAIEAFFADRAPDDLLLLHFSCHGVKSADGRLFLAHRDTKPKLLASTGVPAEFVNDQMASSRAQRIALFLDCCYGGAFPRGLVGRAGDDAHIGDNFRDIEDESSGRGRVVVTASTAMQYSFEADALAADEVQPSLFTGALVEALSTGEADRDGDGWVGLTELFTFVRNQVRAPRPTRRHRCGPTAHRERSFWHAAGYGASLLRNSILKLPLRYAAHFRPLGSVRSTSYASGRWARTCRRRWLLGIRWTSSPATTVRRSAPLWPGCKPKARWASIRRPCT